MCLPHLSVQRALRQQLRMRALRGDRAVLHHGDVVRAGDGGQPVRDHDNHPVFHQSRDRPLDDRLHFGIGGVPPSHADIFPHGVVKEIVVLRHERDLVIQLRQRDVLQLVAAHGDAAGADVSEARGELGDGRFSAAGRADQRRHFILRNGQADAVEDLLIRMVAEADVFEHDGMV